MSDLVIEQPVPVASMAEAKAQLDAALKEQFPGGMLQRRWEGEVLHLTGPGAQGTIVYETGRLVGRAALKPPASLMRPVIEKKISCRYVPGTKERPDFFLAEEGRVADASCAPAALERDRPALVAISGPEFRPVYDLRPPNRLFARRA